MALAAGARLGDYGIVGLLGSGGMGEVYEARATAMRLLDQAYEKHMPQLLHVVADPAFDGLRQDPRYLALIRRIGVHSPH